MFADIFRSKFWRDKERSHFEWLEKEIEALRLKLSEPLLESPVGQMRTLVRHLESERNSGNGLEFHLVKELLKSWEHET